MKQREILNTIFKKIKEFDLDHPVRIGIDGIDGAGKTTFAKILVEYLKQKDEKVIYSSIDKFHNLKEIRYQKGRNSPQAYYEDQFNYKELKKNLLKPLSPDGDLNYRDSFFDYKINKRINEKIKKTDKDSILIFDGVFLCRDEIIDYFDLIIFIDVDFNISLSRVLKREKDKESLGEEDNIKKYYQVKYFPGQKLYFEDAKPKEKVDIIIDNNDFENPKITKY